MGSLQPHTRLHIAVKLAQGAERWKEFFHRPAPGWGKGLSVAKGTFFVAQKFFQINFQRVGSLSNHSALLS
jgi:hypothetical protein